MHFRQRHSVIPTIEFVISNADNFASGLEPTRHDRADSNYI